MKTITINLPDSFEVHGMSDAPEELRVVPTEKWDEEFILAAIENGISQALGDAWSSGKKDVAKLKKRFDSFKGGDWAMRKRTGQSVAVFQAKFDKAIQELNVVALAQKLTPEKLAALAALVKPDNA
jgi:hypothetical protein